nr:PREDICTED: uncharacterized protein LOC105664226 [Megachile rotundata]
MSTIAKNTITATLTSITTNYRRTLTFLTIPNIASNIPDQPIDRTLFKIPNNLTLADPEFSIPAPVDLLLGAGVALSLLSIGQIKLSPPDGPDLYLQKTQLGWIIGGSAPTHRLTKETTCHAITPIQLDLARFWELEDGPQIQHLSKADRECEEYFRKTISRTSEGRYMVALPFNDKLSQLGESKSRALKRFSSLQGRFKRDEEYGRAYRAVLQEYLDLGHMSETQVHNEKDGMYYLPHHGVTKITSDTTKLRVVFDGSAATSTGISLNDTLHVGPKIQDDLLYILLRFRNHQYVLTGDIEKMYRQFLVRPEGRKYQQILWQTSDQTPKTFQLNTVTFGLSAAPYLAIRCLSQLAQDERHRFPQAAQTLITDFYVDDLLTGTATINEALTLQNQLIQILQTAGLNIRQWASNHRALLQNLPEQSINKRLHLGESSTIKTLGVFWDSSDDTIRYSITNSPLTNSFTKRSISSVIAKIYDPLGLLGPVIILAKIMLQKVWTLKLDWDESLPMDTHTEWLKYYKQLPLLNNVAFNRQTLINEPSIVELHGFSDASERAYGACLYLRSMDKHGQCKTQLLMAKSKVAPLKTQSIPRLELCGALLLSSIVTTVQKALKININRTICWTDSTIVLHWIRTSPHLLKTFVANRITEIQNQTNITEWRHVSTSDNPADLISRGLLPEDFLRPSIWQTGPNWLYNTEDQWPTTTITPCNMTLEQREIVCLTTTLPDTSLLDRFSSWEKLVRVIAWCLRWKSTNHTKGPLTTKELRYAHDTIIKLVQKLHFSDELEQLSKGKNPHLKNRLGRLNPFIDSDGILRVGGRLKHSLMPFGQKHPIILPKNRITLLIIDDEHRKQFHTGTQTTLYAVRRRYWPIDGRQQVWKAIKPCVRCCRAQPPPVNYLMGNLPAARVTESRPFTHTGVDYCGPFYIKERKQRNRGRIKVYVAVFVCLAVKAVHLELVSDLTTEAFIAALKRFIARRGLCSYIYSDNGTNFVGANHELQELQLLLRSEEHQNQLTTFLAGKSIEWKFIPPLTPHFGGLWEAAVKSFKYHLKRVAGSELFTFENFNTLIIEIEAILNSRPLTPISSDPNDLLVLTPGHFLIGDSLTSLREKNVTEIPTNRLSSWQQIQKVKQHFWVRWHREYLNELTTRSKWTKGDHPIKEGTIVLLREDNVPSLHWPLAKVIKVHPGTDGIVRAVTVKTAKGTLDRSIKRLVPLPNQSDQSA